MLRTARLRPHHMKGGSLNRAFRTMTAKVRMRFRPSLGSASKSARADAQCAAGSVRATVYTLHKFIVFLLYNIWSSTATRDKGMGMVPEGPTQNSRKQQRRDGDEYYDNRLQGGLTELINSPSVHLPVKSPHLCRSALVRHGPPCNKLPFELRSARSH